MTLELKEYWESEIKEHLKERFGLTVSELVPIEKGWLNVKWRMRTSQQVLFIKYYHPDRYKLHTNPERRRGIEKTLQLQLGLNLAGIPCPKVYLYQCCI